MGDIKKVLAETTLEPRSVTPNGLWVDLCENVHIHFRNNRFDMSKEEFAKFMAGMRNLYKASEFTMNEYKFEEGDPNVLKQLMFKHSFNHNSDYYPNRFVLEWNRDDTYHMHYRDLRVHLTQDEFEDIANAFIKAKQEQDSFTAFEKKYGPIQGPTRKMVALDDVQPYDAGHKPGGICFDHDHEPGIEAVKALIQAGRPIRPILVGKNGQRLDGFKRYMAYKRLGVKQIEVIIDPDGKMGGQHKQPWEIEDGFVLNGQTIGEKSNGTKTSVNENVRSEELKQDAAQNKGAAHGVSASP